MEEYTQRKLCIKCGESRNLQNDGKGYDTMAMYITIGVLILLLGYTFATYNSLTGLRNKVKEAFATMDVYLKKRWDLVPNIVEAVKGYVKHEKETLENVIHLRNSAKGSYDTMSVEDKIGTNEKLSAGVSKIIALAENYPDLIANQNFLDLSAQLEKVEDDIANARKYYNAVVKNMNNKVQMFPSNICAQIFGFKEIAMFETNQSEREHVKVEF